MRDREIRNEIVKSDMDFMADRTIDDLLTEKCLGMTLGSVFKQRETAADAKCFFVTSLITDAVMDQDIEIIEKIVKRIDGTIPDQKSRSGYANIFGDALDDVLKLNKAEQLQVTPDDPPIIAMAKVAIFVALSRPGGNVQKKKQKNLAVDMVLDRVGGRKSEPTKPLLETTYVDPEWMGLPDAYDADDSMGNGRGDRHAEQGDAAVPGMQ